MRVKEKKIALILKFLSLDKLCLFNIILIILLILIKLINVILV